VIGSATASLDRGNPVSAPNSLALYLSDGAAPNETVAVLDTVVVPEGDKVIRLEFDWNLPVAPSKLGSLGFAVVKRGGGPEFTLGRDCPEEDRCNWAIYGFYLQDGQAVRGSHAVADGPAIAPGWNRFVFQARFGRSAHVAFGIAGEEPFVDADVWREAGNSADVGESGAVKVTLGAYPTNFPGPQIDTFLDNLVIHVDDP
jgi:hypothetical protein